MEAPRNFKINGKDQVMNIKTQESYDLEWGGKLEFYNCVVGGAIDARFMPAILKGINEKMTEGPLTGSYARDIRVYVYDGKMHLGGFQTKSPFVLAARNAFKEAFRNAGPKIMEPIYNVEVMTPAEYQGAVMSDLQNRRGILGDMGADKGFSILKARVPLAELYRYSTALSSLTSGSATFSMEFRRLPAGARRRAEQAARGIRRGRGCRSIAESSIHRFLQNRRFRRPVLFFSHPVGKHGDNPRGIARDSTKRRAAGHEDRQPAASYRTPYSGASSRYFSISSSPV